MSTHMFKSSQTPSSKCVRRIRRRPFSSAITCSSATAPSQGTAQAPGSAPPEKKKFRQYLVSDGQQHLGSALQPRPNRPFPVPPEDDGYPLKVIPIGGLGEIGMNCMLVGANGRYIVIDAGLLFPDFQDLGMQKILPDTSFLHQWRDKIEAVVITHGHEDHIGALPWVVPALDPNTPIYASGFVMKLVQRRMQEYSLWKPERFKLFDMRQPFQCGPFEVEAMRVTHSIPDCCGLIMRSQYGTIVHTGDWKIDEDPVDGDAFDRNAFAALAKENVALMMSDSTNVLSPGRTISESVVQESLIRRIMAHQGKGRIVCTQFASNIHRLASVKKAADLAGRKIAFVGMSLTTYLEAAQSVGRAPIDPRDLVSTQDLEHMDPSEVLIVTTGSQAEPRAALSLASNDSSHQLKILPNDLLLYSAKVIPGNEKKVTRMLNRLSMLGASIVQGSSERLHASGHAHQEELTEVLRSVQPQHFLPVHGEYSFLVAHAQLAKEKAGVNYVDVIRNGQVLGVRQRSNGAQISTGSMATLGEAKLINFYHDGARGTGTAAEMALEERTRLAFEGIVIASIDVMRSGAAATPDGVSSNTGGLRARVRVTARGMWLENGRLIGEMDRATHAALERLPVSASLQDVERAVMDVLRKTCRAFNQRKPEVIVFAHEHDPRFGHLTTNAPRPPPQRFQGQQRTGGRGPSNAGAPRPPGDQWGAVPVRPAQGPAQSRPPYPSTQYTPTAAPRTQYNPTAAPTTQYNPTAAALVARATTTTATAATTHVAQPDDIDEFEVKQPAQPSRARPAEDNKMPPAEVEVVAAAAAAAVPLDAEPAPAPAKRRRSAKAAAAEAASSSSNEQGAASDTSSVVPLIAKRRGRKPKATPAATEAGADMPPGEGLQILPEGVLLRRKRANPRDNITGTDDAAFD